MQIRPKGAFERVVMIKEKFSFEPSNAVAPRSSFHFHMSPWKRLFCIPRRFPGFEKLALGPSVSSSLALLEFGRLSAPACHVATVVAFAAVRSRICALSLSLRALSLLCQLEFRPPRTAVATALRRRSTAGSSPVPSLAPARCASDWPIT